MRRAIFATLVTALALALGAGWITPIFNWLALAIAALLVLAVVIGVVLAILIVSSRFLEETRDRIAALGVIRSQ